MSENLQLDRVLPTVQGGQETVELKSLEGITIREIDWKPLIKDLKPELDPLAAKIPADQHAIFFPSFNAAVAVADEMAAQSAMVLELAEPRSTSARTFDRYQEQMCLSITGLARLLGPTVVQSVAITGSDPYFRTGTDVAVLFADRRCHDAPELADCSSRPGGCQNAAAKTVQGEVDGLAVSGSDHAGSQHLQLHGHNGQPRDCHELAVPAATIGERHHEQGQITGRAG